MTELLELVAYEQDADTSLDRLNRAAFALTKSRNAMIATMNDELGCLELDHGVGSEWGASGLSKAQVDVSLQHGIVGYVAATGSSFRSGDVSLEPKYRNVFGSTKSEIAVPVRDRYGRIRAVLNVESDQADAYTEEDEATCKQIALLAAIVLERQEAARREQALIEIANAFDQAWSEEELIEGVIRVAGEVMRFQAFSLFLLDSAAGDFVLRGSVGRLKEKVGEIRYRAGQGCTGWVAEHGKPILLDNPTSDHRWRGMHVEFPSEQIASFLAVPVVSRGKTVGVLRAIRRTTDNPYLNNRFTESDQSVLFAVGEHLASVLGSIRSVKQMMHSERMAAWGELSARSSHMIGNRMFALLGDVNELGFLLDQEPLDQNSLKEIHGHLSLGVTRIEEILQDFRDFLTATQVKPEPHDLNDFVKETVEEMSPHRGDIAIKATLDPGLPKVELDPRRLRRALSELVENSLKYAVADGVTVRTGMASLEEIQIAGLSPNRSYATIKVEDSGPGVRSDEKALIFQPFFSGRVKGMGLGLSIVKGIAEAHGGGVYEAGQEGVGAKFVILLPAFERSKSGNQ